MSLLSSMLAATWSPSTGWPTTTDLLSLVATSYAPELLLKFASATLVLATATNTALVLSLLEVLRGAEASLTIISAQEALATATGLAALEALEAILHAMANLDNLKALDNWYKYDLIPLANILFFAVFTGIFLFNVGMLVWLRYHWWNITFIGGYGLEFVGFLGRIISLKDPSNFNGYLIQSMCLTLSPALIMAGVYFVFAQQVVVHGRQYSVLKPMWYLYFFLTIDIVSLLVQGGGGALASLASNNGKDPTTANWIMFAGILFQVAAMSVFLVFWFEYIHRLYFYDVRRLKKAGQLGVVSDELAVSGSSQLLRRTFGLFFKLFLNTPSTLVYKHTVLEPHYDPRYRHIRQRVLVDYYPVAFTVAVVLIYIRCVFRVVELKQGFRGYLATHEIYLLILDATMIAIAGLIFVPFHPMFVFGRENVLKLAAVKGKRPVSEPIYDSALSELAEMVDYDLGQKRTIV